MVEPPHLPDSRFVVGELLGEGGMARVHRAWHVERGQWCAVKVLRQGVKDKARRRFLTEGALMCRLTHRNLLHGWELDDGPPPFLVMDIAEGGSLKDWVDRYGPMEPRLAVDVAIQICKGVATAHRAKVIHRDIKPHNVLIARKGVCKLTDFGIARVRAADLLQEDVTASGDLMGTLGYMAPEQQSDQAQADERTDVYGIGATLYHVLKGRTPPTNLFAAGEYPETFEGIGEQLLPILLKAVSYKPDDRYDTVSELAKALHDTWELLPPPSPDAKTLMTGIPPEPPPPPGMVRATPNTAPPRDYVSEDRPSLEDAQTPVSASLPSATDPSDFRRALVQSATEAPDEQPRTRWWLAVPVVIAAAIGLFLFDLAWVKSAQNAADQAVHDFLELSVRDVAVVDDLGSLGADQRALLAEYEAVRSAPDLVSRATAADRWIADLHAALEAAADPDERTRAIAERRLQGLEAARGVWKEREALWRSRATSVPGRVVTATGLAKTPP
ncbi:MAG: protein kinase [Alphaproteobacteria bacterium]|nr:protein kinase [Alphaproteobacteria bacterium]